MLDVLVARSKKQVQDVVGELAGRQSILHNNAMENRGRERECAEGITERGNKGRCEVPGRGGRRGGRGRRRGRRGGGCGGRQWRGSSAEGTAGATYRQIDTQKPRARGKGERAKVTAAGEHAVGSNQRPPQRNNSAVSLGSE